MLTALEERNFEILEFYVSLLILIRFTGDAVVLHVLQLNLQGQGQYTESIKTVEENIQSIIKRVNELAGIKESDTGLAPPAFWDLLLI
jgi:hypothetical protein